jgi:hypothetical protein
MFKNSIALLLISVVFTIDKTSARYPRNLN